MFLKKCSFAIRVWFGLTPPPVMVKDHIFTTKKLTLPLQRLLVFWGSFYSWGLDFLNGQNIYFLFTKKYRDSIFLIFSSLI